MSRHKNSTREEVLNLVRINPATAEQLSEEIGITPAGIRSHLNFLESDGLIQRREVIRQGAGQPSILFAATVESEDIYSKAYKPILVTLLDCLSESISDKELQKLMTKVGKKLASQHPFVNRSFEERIHTTMDVLNELGGLLAMESNADEVTLTSYACPLAAAVRCKPQVCSAVRAFIARNDELPGCGTLPAR